MDKGWMAKVAAAIAVVSPLVALLATNGEKFLAVLGGIPAVLSAWSSGLPLGVGSFFLSLTFATLLWLFLLPLMPRARDGAKPHLSVNLISVIAATAVCVGQQALAAHGTGDILRATVVGGIAGLLAPYLGLAARSLFAKPSPPPLPPPAILGRSSQEPPL